MAILDQVKIGNTNYDLSVKEANIQWGGKNFAGSFGAIDAAMVADLGANRMAFAKAEGVTIEYSTNGGSTWTDYGASEAIKLGLTSTSAGLYLGKHNTSGTGTANDRLRITFDTSLSKIYTQLNKFVLLVSTNGASGFTCTIDAATNGAPTTFHTFADHIPLSGWSGYNVINTSIITTYGNNSSQYQKLRFTFAQTAANSNYTSASVSTILGFGGVGWTTPSNMAKNGHIYSFDSQQNVTFPAQVKATTFNGNATTATTATTATVAQSTNASRATKSILTIAAEQPNQTEACWFGGSDAVNPCEMPETYCFCTIKKGSNQRTLIDCFSLVNGKHWINSNANVATDPWSGWQLQPNATDKTKLDGIASGATKVTSSTVEGWGYTKNTGTVTSVKVKINGVEKGPVTTSGTIDLGSGYLTSHQSVTNNAPTLAWGTTSTIGTIGGTALTVKMPGNPNTDTHWTTGLFIGASNTKANAAATNPYIKLYDNDTKRAEFKITGSGATTVTSDANGNITISSTDTNTDTNTSHNHSAGVGLTGSGSAGTSDNTYTYKVNLVNETKASNAASYTAGADSKFYAVQLDKNNKLGVYVPWTDTNTDTGYTSLSVTGTGSVVTNVSGSGRALTVTKGTHVLTGGSQTTTSNADGGSNVFTFTKSDGTSSTFTVKNGSKGSVGPTGPTGAASTVAGPTGPTGYMGSVASSTSKIYVAGVTSSGASTLYCNTSVYCSGSVLYGAAWNDYAEYREVNETIEPGRVVVETGKGDLVLATERLQPGAEIISDTYGFCIGETAKSKTPIAVTGRVLVYTLEDRNSFAAGDPVCAGPNGTVSRMTRDEVREYPDRIIGTVSEIPSYDTWGAGNIKINNRIWIRIK